MYTFFKFLGLALVAFGLFAITAGREIGLGGSCITIGLSMIVSAVLFAALREHLDQMREQTRLLRAIQEAMPTQND